MIKCSENMFSTHDIFLSSALLSLGYKIEILDKTNPQKVNFIFQREDGLDEAVQGYWSLKLQIEPQLFSSNLRSLKNRIYSA